MSSEIFKLENGLTCVCESVNAFRSVAVGLWVLSGSVYERPAVNGVSHFIEHMVFKGTFNRSARDIAVESDAAGGYLNAFTEKECTCFYTKVVDTQLDGALDLLSDLALRPRFDEEDIAREKGVVLEEISMYDDTPDDLVFELNCLAHYGANCFSRPVLGTEKTLMALKREDVLSYYREMYRPECAVLAVSGSCDPGEVKRLAEKYFAAWQGTGKPRPRVRTPQPVFGQRKKSKAIEQMHLCLSYPCPSPYEREYYAANFLSTVYGGASSSRLVQVLREDNALAYSVFTGVSSILDSGFLNVYAAVNPENLTEAMKLIGRETEKLKNEGVTEEELLHARDQIISGILLSEESATNRMLAMGRRYLMHGLVLSSDQIISSVEKVTRADADRMGKKVLSEKSAIAVVGPVKGMKEVFECF